MFLTLRYIDGQPEIRFWSSQSDAWDFYLKAKVQWTEVYLCQVVDCPPEAERAAKEVSE